MLPGTCFSKKGAHGGSRVALVGLTARADIRGLA